MLTRKRRLLSYKQASYKLRRQSENKWLFYMRYEVHCRHLACEQIFEEKQSSSNQVYQMLYRPRSRNEAHMNKRSLVVWLQKSSLLRALRKSFVCPLDSSAVRTRQAIYYRLRRLRTQATNVLHGSTRCYEGEIYKLRKHWSVYGLAKMQQQCTTLISNLDAWAVGLKDIISIQQLGLSSCCSPDSAQQDLQIFGMTQHVEIYDCVGLIKDFCFEFFIIESLGLASLSPLPWKTKDYLLCLIAYLRSINQCLPRLHCTCPQGLNSEKECYA